VLQFLTGQARSVKIHVQTESRDEEEAMKFPSPTKLVDVCES